VPNNKTVGCVRPNNTDGNACRDFTGLMIPPDWSNFWKQSKQQGWNPKIVGRAKAVLFSSGMEALGDIGYGIAGPQYRHPTFPYKSSLTGETCQQLADEWEKRTGEMWQQPVLTTSWAK
jgi:branched-chain amino acid transport system substrate-binding protein